MLKGLRLTATAALTAGTALLAPTTAAAGPAQVERTFEFREFTNTCNGDQLILIGTATTVTKATTDGNVYQQRLTLHADGYSLNDGVYGPESDYRFNVSGGFTSAAPHSGGRVFTQVMVSTDGRPNRILALLVNSHTGEIEFTEKCTG